jgi:tryptophan 2,3-dioxygenase
MDYSSYLQLDKILDAQAMESAKHGEPAHDEHLFIVIHQTYELWFKQVLWDLGSIIKVLEKDFIPEDEMGNLEPTLRAHAPTASTAY